MDVEISKVTAFIIREVAGKRQLLVFRHPRAGIQLPTGAVEASETPESAMLRVIRDVTGLADVEIVVCLDTSEQVLEGKDRVLAEPYALEVEPGDSGRLVARLTRGSPVQVIENEGHYTHVWYNFKLEDGVLRPDLQYTGWLPGKFLTNQTRQYLFQVKTTAPTEDQWSSKVKYPTLDFYWADMNVELVPPQQVWLDRVRDRL